MTKKLQKALDDMTDIHRQLIYLAGPITDDDETKQRENLISAIDMAAKLRANGYLVICPHEMGYHHPNNDMTTKKNACRIHFFTHK